MSPDPQNGKPRNVFKGSTGLIVAVGVVVVVCIAFPAYRWFILISIGIGVLAAGILSLWHRLRPLKEADIERKRPLGLD
jgi:peptidoglycan biosynthesis protein MviN/MurJ (putative lipid II flippase)